LEKAKPLRSNFEHALTQYTSNLQNWNDQNLNSFPSIKFGLETAIADLNRGGVGITHHSSFAEGKTKIKINGLIWMNSIQHMKEQVKAKVKAGFDTIKIKVGALDFEEELQLLKWIRAEFGFDYTLRLDANGAFSPQSALEKLHRLSEYQIHSIEQPIKQGQPDEMAQLCEKTPIPIALDEELIGIHHYEDKIKLLTQIKPQYIILKPTLIGGFADSKSWIKIAEQLGIGFWFTSALESNIGLNAICQMAAHYNTNFAQGLGTGGLYSNNFESRLRVEKGYIFCV
jgi:o-succinylbenzoate synthase